MSPGMPPESSNFRRCRSRIRRHWSRPRSPSILPQSVGRPSRSNRSGLTPDGVTLPGALRTSPRTFEPAFALRATARQALEPLYFRLMSRFLTASVLLLLSFGTASAQITADGPVVYGHHHLAVSNIDATKKFWVDTLGGTATTFTSGTQAIRFPGVFILMRAQAPKGGSKGSTVNHLGFSVPDLAKTLEKVRSGGYKIVTREEAVSPREIVNDIAVMTSGTSIAFVMAPDDVKVELVETKTQTTPIALHHVHFFGTQPAEMQAWYAKVFGAAARPGGQIISATLPGVTLSFSASTEPTVGTTGRAIDHIGFEVKNLEAFTKQLEASGIKINTSYRQVPKTEMWIAFITDPWGTSIELSEGLAKIP